jgi:hypothetical protein
MKGYIAWLLGAVVCVPALLAWGADGNAGDFAQRHISAAEINAHVAWTQEQRGQVLQLLKARADQVKPIQEQLRQLQEQMKPLLEQMRGINEQFEQSLTALSTSDQIAAARERIAEHGWAASQPAHETTRHHDGSASRPADEAIRHHDWAASRPADERIHHHDGATSRPAGEIDPDHRHKLKLEKEHLQREVAHINRQLQEHR